jgi:hypothetical protein
MFIGMTIAFLTEKMSGWVNDIECMVEAKTEYSLKAVILVFFCLLLHFLIHLLVLCLESLHLTLKFQTSLNEMSTSKTWLTFVTYHLEAFLDSTGYQLRPAQELGPYTAMHKYYNNFPTNKQNCEQGGSAV